MYAESLNRTVQSGLFQCLSSCLALFPSGFMFNFYVSPCSSLLAVALGTNTVNAKGPLHCRRTFNWFPLETLTNSASVNLLVCVLTYSRTGFPMLWGVCVCVCVCVIRDSAPRRGSCVVSHLHGGCEAFSNVLLPSPTPRTDCYSLSVPLASQFHLCSAPAF